MQRHSAALARKRFRAVSAILLFVLTLTATGCGPVTCCGHEPEFEAASATNPALPQRLSANERYRVDVIRVIDGDTFEITWYEGETVGVRVLGIDTPERGKPGFAEATDYLRGRIGDSAVELVFPEGKIKRDSFGRFLAEVWVDGGNLGWEMLDLEHAETYSGE